MKKICIQFGYFCSILILSSCTKEILFDVGKSGSVSPTSGSGSMACDFVNTAQSPSSSVVYSQSAVENLEIHYLCESTEGPITYDCKLPGEASFHSCSGIIDSNGVLIEEPTNLPVGIHTYVFRGTDAAGRVELDTLNISVENDAPVATTCDILSFNNPSNTSYYDIPFTCTGDLVANPPECSQVSGSVASNSFSQSTCPNGNSFDNSGLPDGNYTFCVKQGGDPVCETYEILSPQWVDQVPGTEIDTNVVYEVEECISQASGPGTCPIIDSTWTYELTPRADELKHRKKAVSCASGYVNTAVAPSFVCVLPTNGNWVDQNPPTEIDNNIIYEVEECVGQANGGNSCPTTDTLWTYETSPRADGLKHRKKATACAAGYNDINNSQSVFDCQLPANGNWVDQNPPTEIVNNIVYEVEECVGQANGGDACPTADTSWTYEANPRSDGLKHRKKATACESGYVDVNASASIFDCQLPVDGVWIDQTLPTSFTKLPGHVYEEQKCTEPQNQGADCPIDQTYTPYSVGGVQYRYKVTGCSIPYVDVNSNANVVDCRMPVDGVWIATTAPDPFTIRELCDEPEFTGADCASSGTGWTTPTKPANGNWYRSRCNVSAHPGLVMRSGICLRDGVWSASSNVTDSASHIVYEEQTCNNPTLLNGGNNCNETSGFSLVTSSNPRKQRKAIACASGYVDIDSSAAFQCAILSWGTPVDDVSSIPSDEEKEKRCSSYCEEGTITFDVTTNRECLADGSAVSAALCVTNLNGVASEVDSRTEACDVSSSLRNTFTHQMKSMPVDFNYPASMNVPSHLRPFVHISRFVNAEQISVENQSGAAQQNVKAQNTINTFDLKKSNTRKFSAWTNPAVHLGRQAIYLCKTRPKVSWFHDAYKVSNSDSSVVVSEKASGYTQWVADTYNRVSHINDNAIEHFPSGRTAVHGGVRYCCAAGDSRCNLSKAPTGDFKTDLDLSGSNGDPYQGVAVGILYYAHIGSVDSDEVDSHLDEKGLVKMGTCWKDAGYAAHNQSEEGYSHTVPRSQCSEGHGYSDSNNLYTCPAK